MKQKLFYFLCTALLSVETSWCSEGIDLWDSSSSTKKNLLFGKIVLDDNCHYTIFANNWKSFENDIIILKNKIMNPAVINPGLIESIKDNKVLVYSDTTVLEEINTGQKL